MRVIVLAAGEGLQLDGFTKLLIRHPRGGKRVIDLYLELFAGLRMTVVLGCRALEVMHRYPWLDYVYNPDWRLTSNAYSLALALTEEPCFVLSSDFFLAPALIERLKEAGPDALIVSQREDRAATAVNCVLQADGSVAEIYQGRPRQGSDPEVTGIFKISSPEMLRAWRRRCLARGEQFAALALPLELGLPLQAVDQTADALDEINTHEDYLRLLQRELA